MRRGLRVSRSALFDGSNIGAKIIKAQCQLTRIEPLRTPPELHALELFDDLPEPFDLAITMVKQRRHVTHQAVQKRHILGKIIEVDLHD